MHAKAFIGPRAWDSIVTHVETILRKEGTKDERIRTWKEAISSGTFCHVTEIDQHIHYEKQLWFPTRIMDRCEKGTDIRDSHSYRFYRAAWRHRNYILHELLPEIGLLL
ncbi:MAG: hypothetical protein JRI51_09360 [Deltaproteobacteria bacterium]|nr:hypothetical protein [Deltaproteobacteria bacterium]